MVLTCDNIIHNIIKLKGTKEIKEEFQNHIDKVINIATNDGLSESNLNRLVDFLDTVELNSSNNIYLISCLIPATHVPKECLEKILMWFFTKVAQNKITVQVEKKFFQWIIGIVHYELADLTVIDSFYYSFLFLLRRPHIQGLVCKLLCLISKPEDAKRWIVLKLLRFRDLCGEKSSLNSVLSLLKSYRPEVVPERVSITYFSYENLGYFDEPLKKAHSRNISDKNQSKISQNNEIQWNLRNAFEDKKMTQRLIPALECINLENDMLNQKKKLKSIIDLKTMTSVALNFHHIEYPAQILSLLANNVGHHILAFSSLEIKDRFLHKLYYTLCRVFLLELSTHSEKEKVNFLEAIKKFQEYTLQSIPVVTTFLLNYLLIWDGKSYQKEILGLLEWIEIQNEGDLRKFVFSPLQQIFLSFGSHTKSLIIQTLGKLVRNLLIMSKREQNCFPNNYQECDVVKSIEAIGAFVSNLINIGLIWNNDKKSKGVLISALEFYEITGAVEQAGDLPLIVIMPPSLVYKALFSGSRLTVAKVCSLLTRLQVDSVERLYALGVYQDFADEVKKLRVYILDYYRCFWSYTSFMKNEMSFIFHDNKFRKSLLKFKEPYGDILEKIFRIEFNSTFCLPQSMGNLESMMIQLANDYPAVLELKRIAEEQILQS